MIDMRELILLAVALPLITGMVTILNRKPRLIKIVNLTGSFLTSLILIVIIYNITLCGFFSNGMLYVDQLSAVLLLVVAVLTFTAVLFSVSYMEQELMDGHISLKMLPRYYGLLNVFVFTMISVLVVGNLGLMWVAVEATTLASALLVAFYFNRSALEAAWKYVMVCTVGICLALLGTIILYYAQVNAVGPESPALDWVVLKNSSAGLDPAMAKLAFIFILIGYGTKAGLAPMHTWLPDAHSQAPSPVSGLLSGALLSCALYAIIRNMIVVQGAIGSEFVQYLLIGFGMASILIAVPFILVQHDLKRLLAYSSVEHIGLITVGLGIGTPLAVYAALLHIVNHAAAKSMLFYLAGIITQQYHTKNIMRIRGLVSAAPMVGTLFIIAILTITGSPPFNIFISKFLLVWAAFAAGHWLLGALTLLLLSGVFAGMMYYCLRMAFGHTPRKLEFTPIGAPAMAAMFLSMGIIVVGGLYVPPWFHTILTQAAAIVVGGTL